MKWISFGALDLYLRKTVALNMAYSDVVSGIAQYILCQGAGMAPDTKMLLAEGTIDDKVMSMVKWIPTKEREPEIPPGDLSIGPLLFIAINNDGKSEVHVGSRHINGWYYPTEDLFLPSAPGPKALNGYRCAVTHWAELPKPPEEKSCG